MNTLVAKESLTAWQRWEMGSLDENKACARTPSANTTAAPADNPANKLPTADDIERIHRDAHKQGYDAGYEEGTARVRMEAMRLHALVEKLDTALGEFDQQVSEELLALSIEIARQVVRQSIAARPELILDVVREGLSHLPQQHVAIHLHPEDAALARTHLGEQITHLGHRIFEDAGIARGGVRMEAGGSQLDASVENRWKRVLASMGMSGEWIEPNR